MYMETKSKKETDLINMRFGSLTATHLVRGIKVKDQIWVCACDCGNTRPILRERLTKGQAKSCGCEDVKKDKAPAQPREVKRGKIPGESLFPLWSGVHRKTCDPFSSTYAACGGSGVTLFPPWRDFPVFAEYADRVLGERPDGCSLCRLDDAKGYEPNNVAWLTSKQQAEKRKLKKEMENGN